jgi:hypothetical protein
MRSLEKSRQLNRNLHGYARHSGDIKEFTPPPKEREKKTLLLGCTKQAGL